jgi:hypothetical protein
LHCRAASAPWRTRMTKRVLFVCALRPFAARSDARLGVPPPQVRLRVQDGAPDLSDYVHAKWMENWDIPDPAQDLLAERILRLGPSLARVNKPISVKELPHGTDPYHPAV